MSGKLARLVRASRWIASPVLIVGLLCGPACSTTWSLVGSDWSRVSERHLRPHIPPLLEPADLLFIFGFLLGIPHLENTPAISAKLPTWFRKYD